MTKKELKQLRRIIALIASKRESVGIRFNEVNFSVPCSVNYLQIWCTNTAYVHELNALMMSIDGFGFCTCHQVVTEDGDIVWEVY